MTKERGAIINVLKGKKEQAMPFSRNKPYKYAKCVCCKSTASLTDYQFGDDDGIKIGITLCSNCVTNMYKESQKEDLDDKRAKISNTDVGTR